MAERSADRAASISSSHSEAEVFDEQEKNGTSSLSNGNHIPLKNPDELEVGDDVERAELLPQDSEKPQVATPDNSTRTAVIWMVVNTLATIGIVGVVSLWMWD